jgi:riboflavin synthase
MGVVERLEPRAGGARITIRPTSLPVDELDPGESVACNGACLTVVERGGGRMTFDAVPETLARTTLGAWKQGTRVNLERALRLSDRLGGHLVQGHVDGVGKVLARVTEGLGARLTVSLPPGIAPLVAEKGSIAIDGVSLTVARAGRDRFEVALIPETLSRTTLGAAAPGTQVNLEADIVARHVARLREFEGTSGISEVSLKDWGYGGERA